MFKCASSGVQAYNVKATLDVVLMVFPHRLQTLQACGFRKAGDWSSHFFLALLLLTLSPAFCAAQTSLDLDGKRVNPLNSNAGRPVVLVFVQEDCPVSRRYAPRIQQISDEYQKSARFYLIFPNKSESPSDIRKYLSEFYYSIPGLRDPEHALVRKARAQVTPEAAVFDGKGVLVYHGRIDNLYESFGHARSAPTTHDLEDAIQATLAGRAPSNKEVAGVGCYISDLQ
jgi:thiol-disulfide isomerase/thioredoxin